MAEGDSVPVRLRTILIVDHYYGLQPGKERNAYLNYLHANRDVPGYSAAHTEILAINKRNRNARTR